MPPGLLTRTRKRSEPLTVLIVLARTLPIGAGFDGFDRHGDARADAAFEQRIARRTKLNRRTRTRADRRADGNRDRGTAQIAKDDLADGLVGGFLRGAGGGDGATLDQVRLDRTLAGNWRAPGRARSGRRPPII